MTTWGGSLSSPVNSTLHANLFSRCGLIRSIWCNGGGPKGFTNPVCEWDAQPGKAIYVVMRGPNGADYPMSGEFREVVEPERLVFTSGALDEKGILLFEFLHTVTFVERKGKTTLTVQSRVIKTTVEANKYIGGFEAGMTQSLDRLVEYILHIP